MLVSVEHGPGGGIDHLVKLEVPPDADGDRLDAHLAGPLGSRSRAQRLIAAGRVRVDGRTVAKRHAVRAGERVEVDLDEDRPPAVAPPSVPVVLEDDHLLVVDKPAGIVVHPAGRHASGTLADALAGRAVGGADPARAGIVHRLDRDTSGLLVVAKSHAVHAALQQMLCDRSLQREYLALVEGRPPARTGSIDAPLGRDRRVRTRRSTDTDEPREAITHFAIELELASATLLRVRLETGRTHQIRAHLLAIGHPVVGDPEYGAPASPARPTARLGLGRQFLHAARLAFPHPVTRAPVDLVSPLPDDLAAALARARTI